MKKGCLITGMVNFLLIIFLLCFLYIKNPYVQFSGDDIITILGIIVSCISIVITGFFVVLAIDAYGRINEIEENANDAKKYAENAKKSAEKAKTDLEKAKSKVEEIEKTYDSARQSLKRIGAATETCYDCSLKFIEIVGQSSTNKNSIKRYKKWRDEVHRNLYRMGLHPFILDEDTRVQYILNLAAFGEKSDIESLETLYKSEKSQKVKEAEKQVIDALKEKYP